MFGSATQPDFHRRSYSGTSAASLRRARAALLRFVPLAVIVSLALATGACSFSYKLGSLFGNDKGGERSEPTGAISAAPPAAEPSAVPSDGDLAFAKAAASEALNRGNDVSVAWENPRTGARGMVTPLANAYTQDGFVCRDFLASHVRGRTESWLQGEACRVHQGRWEVRHLKPWKRP